MRRFCSALIALLVAWPAFAVSPPSQDGSATTAQATPGSLTPFSINASITSNTNDVIVIITSVENTSTVPSVSTISGGGLTWTLRKRIVYQGGGLAMEEWYAVAPTAISSGSYLLTWTGANWDNAGAICFALTGATIAAPFDPNASWPGSFVNTATSTTPTVTFSTTLPDDFLISAVANTVNQTSYTQPSGFTQIANNLNVGGVFYLWANVGGQSVTSAQSGVTVAGGTFSQSTIQLVDGFTANTSAGSFLPLMGVGQ
jgi:hypothetical protein